MSTKELSGRALDAAVAERVMQWRTSKISANVWYSEAESNSFHKDKFRPSESIEAAMCVVEKMRERGVWTQIQTFTHTTQVRVEMGVPSSECQEWGATMAEAICRCALKAAVKFELFAEKLAAMEQKS